MSDVIQPYHMCIWQNSVEIKQEIFASKINSSRKLLVDGKMSVFSEVLKTFNQKPSKCEKFLFLN